MARPPCIDIKKIDEITHTSAWAVTPTPPCSTPSSPPRAPRSWWRASCCRPGREHWGNEPGQCRDSVKREDESENNEENVTDLKEPVTSPVKGWEDGRVNVAAVYALKIFIYEKKWKVKSDISSEIR